MRSTLPVWERVQRIENDITLRRPDVQLFVVEIVSRRRLSHLVG
jgi:hypothetical protein